MGQIMDMCICITDSPYCKPETNTTLQINCTTIHFLKVRESKNGKYKAGFYLFHSNVKLHKFQQSRK